MDARCQCGRIKFTTPLPKPTEIYFCHCLECRHQSSSAFGISAGFPYFEIEAEPGAIATWTKSTELEDQVLKFCATCGSMLMGIPYSKDGRRPEIVNVKGGCLVGLTKEMLDGAMHIWTKRAVVPIPEGVLAYEEMPPE